MKHVLSKMNVATVKPKTIKKNKASTFSAYLLESFNLWHGGLRYVNYDTFYGLINLDHILAFHIDSQHNYETYLEVKQIRSSF